MKKPLFRTPTRAARLFTLLLALPALGALPGCTNLTESPTSSITPENFFQNEQEVLAGLAGAYAELRGTLWAYYNVSQISSDEHIIPTRGSDWYDNGRWLEIHRQQWGATTPSGLTDLGDMWSNLFSGVSRTNIVLDALERVTVPNEPVIQAELRALRAFYYYLLMDMFGGVPIVTDTKIQPRARATRAEVFTFVENELNAARAVLPATWVESQNGRLTKGACDAILANMYLNARVFTGTVTTAGLQPGAARWDDAIAAADRILNSGVYSLATDWRSNFRADNHLSPENIMVVKHLNQDGLGMNFLMRALHYSQLNPSPWNGFATLAETYNAFDPADQRREIFLVGPQFSLETGEPVYERNGRRLDYTVTIANETQATESEGARIAKWTFDPNHAGPNYSNDFAYFRLGEIYLIKAEALNEKGLTAEAAALVNTLRARVFEPDKPLVAATFNQATFRDQILKERLFELTAEAKRRQDLIRHGKFTQAWAFKPQREPYRILMAIPQSQLDANPMLEQNPGY